MSSLLAGRVQTVLGSIGAEGVGITLPHEHLPRGESLGAAARISFLALPMFLPITAMTASTVTSAWSSCQQS